MSQTHLILHNVTCDDWTDHTRQCGHCIGQPHQHTGMLRGDVQVVDTEHIIKTEELNLWKVAVCVCVCVWFSAGFEQSISCTSTKSKLYYDNSLQIYANEPTL